MVSMRQEWLAVTIDELQQLRQKIDALDEQILVLINRRGELASQVAEAKMARGEQQNFYRPEREAEVLRRVRQLHRGPLPEEAVLRLFRELMSACLALEKPIEVGFLGPEGTFTQEAAFKHFGHAVLASPVPAINEIFRAVESGSVQFGVVPVENSTEGVVTHTLDSFLDSPLKISGEVVLRIHHNVLSRAAAVTEIREIYAHQQALAQCRQWLDRFLPGVPRTAVSSNAEAARLAGAQPTAAALAGDAAAGLYHLQILARNVEDEPDNTTRFLVISNHEVAPTGEDKTTICISTNNVPGALFHALEPFARYGISLTKIESRPSRRAPWDYVFFLDFEGHVVDPVVTQACGELRQRVHHYNHLGSYPKAII